MEFTFNEMCTHLMHNKSKAARCTQLEYEMEYLNKSTLGYLLCSDSLATPDE